MGTRAYTPAAYATAIGYYTSAEAWRSTVVGSYNTRSGLTTSWSWTDPMFVVGCGSSETTRTNGFTVNKNGDCTVKGVLTSGTKDFLIDHPLDPKNKVLRHSVVESPDIKNLYDGVVTLDNKGVAVVELPKYFEALNRDYRYQLTCVGDYAPIFIKQKIKGNKFVIAGGKPGLEVSWMVTGIRQDAFARKHPIVVEEEKGTGTSKNIVKGKYIHPDSF